MGAYLFGRETGTKLVAARRKGNAPGRDDEDSLVGRTLRLRVSTGAGICIGASVGKGRMIGVGVGNGVNLGVTVGAGACAGMLPMKQAD